MEASIQEATVAALLARDAVIWALRKATVSGEANRLAGSLHRALAQPESIYDMDRALREVEAVLFSAAEIIEAGTWREAGEMSAEALSWDHVSTAVRALRGAMVRLDALLTARRFCAD